MPYAKEPTAGARAQGPTRCLGGCCTAEEATQPGKECFECHEPCVDDVHACNLALDLSNARGCPGVDVVPTFTTNNKRMCLMLATGQMGMLRIEDAERLQACASCRSRMPPQC